MGKKKGPKAAAAGEVEDDDAVLAEAVAAAAAEGAVAAAPAPEESGDEEAPADGQDAALAKKKRRSKKKGGAAAGTEEPAADGAEAKEVAEDKEAAVPKEEAEGEDGEDGEDEEAADGDEGANGKKKKKRRPKKKGGGSGAAGVACNPGAPRADDEEFQNWVKSTMEARANGSEKMPPEDLMKPPKPFWGYKYTGELRPAYVTPQLRMPEDIMRPDYATDEDGASISERTGPKEVPILEGKPLATMREACRLGREVLDIASRYMRAGVTGDEIDRVVFQACVDRKIYPSPLNYYRFPKSVCVSPNEVICHGIPDCRPIENGDIVNLDISIYHEGFHSDLNETFFIGECDEDSHRLVRTAYNSLRGAAELIRPGTFYRDLGNAIHAEAAKNNCAVVTTYCGHGVGELFHGPPKVPHYRKNKAVGIMKPGHVFTVEPMINLGPNGGDKMWPDNWTAVTRDGKRSAQFEHTFLVTENGYEVLTCRLGTDRSVMPEYDPAMFQV